MLERVAREDINRGFGKTNVQEGLVSAANASQTQTLALLLLNP